MTISTFCQESILLLGHLKITLFEKRLIITGTYNSGENLASELLAFYNE
jgi:hypothetical protein